MIKFFRDFAVPTLVVGGLVWLFGRPLAILTENVLPIPMWIFILSAFWLTLVWFLREASFRRTFLSITMMLFWLVTAFLINLSVFIFFFRKVWLAAGPDLIWMLVYLFLMAATGFLLFLITVPKKAGDHPPK